MGPTADAPLLDRAGAAECRCVHLNILEGAWGRLGRNDGQLILICCLTHARTCQRPALTANPPAPEAPIPPPAENKGEGGESRRQ